MKHFIFDYIGQPWVANARGPDAFDCWGLVWHIKKHCYNQNLPEFLEVDANCYMSTSMLIEKEIAKRDLWKQLKKPEDGCIVSLANWNEIHNCDLYMEIDKGIIINGQRNKGVVAERLS